MQDYIKQTIKVLNEGTVEQKLEAITDIRENGSLLVLPAVIDLLSSSKNQDLTEAIVGLLQDVKEQSAAGYFVAAMKDPRYASILPVLVECCWENGLNFSADLRFFVDMVVHSEFKLAFDAFTILENMEHTYSEEVRMAEIIHIKDCLMDVDHDRKLLLASLIDVL